MYILATLSNCGNIIAGQLKIFMKKLMVDEKLTILSPRPGKNGSCEAQNSRDAYGPLSSNCFELVSAKAEFWQQVRIGMGIILGMIGCHGNHA